MKWKKELDVKEPKPTRGRLPLKDESIDKKVKFEPKVELKTEWNPYALSDPKADTTSGHPNSSILNSKRHRWVVQVVVPTWAQLRRERRRMGNATSQETKKSDIRKQDLEEEKIKMKLQDELDLDTRVSPEEYVEVVKIHTVTPEQAGMDMRSSPTFMREESPEIVLLESAPAQFAQARMRTRSSPIVIREESPEIVLLGSAPAPQKRRRLNDGTAENINPTPDLDREEELEQIKKLINPKIKKVKDMTFDLDTVRMRLSNIRKEFEIPANDREISELCVPRAFISATFGGNPQVTFPTPGPKFLNVHHMDDFMFLNPEYQPVAPGFPGKAGIWFNVGLDDCSEAPRRVFTRVETGKRNLWQFMGMYKLLIADPPFLTTKEWADQKPSVQRTWGVQIRTKSWGFGVCATIQARKELGREPTTEEVADVFSSERWKSVTTEEVVHAYLSGEEQMYLYTMECIGYDSAFQRQIYQKYPLWTPRPKKPRQKKDNTVTLKIPKVAKNKSKEDLAENKLKRKRSVRPKKEEALDSDDESR